MPDPRPLAVELRRHFATPPKAVFEAFSRPDMLVQWFSPAPEIRLSILEFDFREGGKYRFAYHLPSRDTLIVGGVYRAIKPVSLISFSWVWDEPDEHAGSHSNVRISITAEREGAALLIRHEYLAPHGAVERHEAGWAGALTRLAALFEEQFGDGVRC